MLAMLEYTPTRTLSGDDLRLLRVVRRVPATAMAAHYGASRAAICNLERAIRPRPATAIRYLRALAAVLAERERE